VLAPEGTVAEICVAERMENVALAPLNCTAVTPLKFVPTINTVVPTVPVVGENEERVALAVTEKSAVLVAVPPGALTLTFPVLAPAGTVALI